MKKKQKKTNHLTYTTDDIVKGMQRDYVELTEKPITVSVGELSREILKPGGAYLTNLWKQVDHAREKLHGDFWIETRVKLEEVIRFKIQREHHIRVLCPTPTPGQAVYHWIAAKEELDLLWDLPVKKSCKFGYRNRFALAARKPGGALKYILDYYDGTLERLTRKMNKEVHDGKIHRIVTNEQYEQLARDNHKRNSFGGNGTGPGGGSIIIPGN